MGMERMFSDGAEFGNLLETDERMKVSKVVHKAFIEVNEEGAEAAAATGRIIKYFGIFMSCFFPIFYLLLCCTYTYKPFHYSIIILNSKIHSQLFES